jgi:hemin uptake protein HemP
VQPCRRSRSIYSRRAQPVARHAMRVFHAPRLMSCNARDLPNQALEISHQGAEYTSLAGAFSRCSGPNAVPRCARTFAEQALRRRCVWATLDCGGV